MGNYIYRFLNKENEIIYIGKTTDLKRRIVTHDHLPKQCYNEKVKVEFIEFESPDEMDLAERYFIPKYKPKYNTLMKDRVINISLSEFDSRGWTDMENLKKFQTQKKIDRKIDRKIDKIKRDIEIYISYLEIENNIDIDINIDDHNITVETYRDFYNYLDDIVDAAILKKNYHNYNNRKVMCTCSGDIFNNLIEYKQYMNTNQPLEILVKVASDNKEKIFLGIDHPKYKGIFSIPVFVDVFEVYDLERKRNIQRNILENTRSIICLTDMQLYCNKYHAEEETHICHSRITYCCNNKSNYAGTANNKPLVWRWYDEYLEMTENEIEQCIIKAEQIYCKRNKAI